MRTWDLLTGQQIGRPLVGHTRVGHRLRRGPHGRPHRGRVLVRRYSGLRCGPRSAFWDLAAGTPLGASLTDHPLAERIAAASDGDAPLLVAVPSDGPITVWDVQRLVPEVTS